MTQPLPPTTLKPDFDKLLASAKALPVFADFCEREQQADYLECYLAIQSYKKTLNQDDDAGHDHQQEPSNPLSKLFSGLSRWVPLPRNRNRRNRNGANEEASHEGSVGFSEMDDDDYSITNTTTTAEEDQTTTSHSDMYISIRNLSERTLLTAYEQCGSIMDQFILAGAPRQILIEQETRLELERDSRLHAFPSFCTHLSTPQKLQLFDAVEYELLLSLMGDVFSRFIASEEWREWRQQHKDEAKRIRRDDIFFERISQQDFARDHLLGKDFQLYRVIENLYDFMETKEGMSIYWGSADPLLEEDSPLKGKFSLVKYSGYVDCPAEWVMTCMSEDDFLAESMPHMLYDRDVNGHTENHFKFLENSKPEFPSFLYTNHLMVGKIWDIRTTHLVESIIYRNGVYIQVAKTVCNDNFSSTHTTYENGILKSKKTIQAQYYMFFICAPIGHNRCHVTSIFTINAGGVLGQVYKQSTEVLTLLYRTMLMEQAGKWRREKKKLAVGHGVVKACLEASMRAEGGSLRDTTYPETLEEFCQEFW